MTEAERLLYRSYMESLRNARSMLSASYEDGEAKGKAEGEAIGEARGIEKTAKNMKAKGSDVAFISEVTGLSPEEIEKL
jgi:predicted transposase/invertase (TIGR01784 family)